MRAAIHFLVTRSLVVNLISVFLIALGITVALLFMKVEAFPNVNLDIIQIDVVYPGASPSEVEQLVITPIEQDLRSIEGIDKMISMAFSPFRTNFHGNSIPNSPPPAIALTLRKSFTGLVEPGPNPCPG